MLKRKDRIKLLINILLLTAGIFFQVGCDDRFVEYVPVELVVEKGDHKLQKNPALLTSAHIEAMKFVLEKYGEQYKIINDKLYIKKTLMDDLDLLQNYTSKAEILLKEQQ